MKSDNSNLSIKEKLLYYIILFFFSISVNQYFGSQGVCPIDSFWFFNSGYDILNGHYPFKDYWTITGPFIGFSQAFFFKIFGVSWFSYVFHASFLNFLIAASTFYTLNNFKLNIHYSLLYALLVSILAYPNVGTPYVDHHASILSIISIFCFILALKTDKKIFWLALPILISISFLTKQAPSGNFFLIILSLSLIYFIFNFNFNKLFYVCLSSIIVIGIFFLTLYITKISLNSFYNQYILFPLSIGEIRFQNLLLPLEFNRIFLRFKLIHISLIILIIVSIKNILKNPKYIINNEFLISLSLIGSSYALIAHQLMTVNGMYIFFIIPILVGFSHIYYLKYFESKKIILYLLIFLSFGSTIHYGYKYIYIRDFMDLRNVDMSKYVNAELLDKKLKGLKWISCMRPNEPKLEVTELNEAINIIKNDQKNKSIITDYQFVSVILSLYDYSPSQVWFIDHVSRQEKNSKFFKKYKKLLTNQLIKNNIEIVYVIKPIWIGDDVFENNINENCFDKVEVTNILDSYLLKRCDEL